MPTIFFPSTPYRRRVKRHAMATNIQAISYRMFHHGLFTMVVRVSACRGRRIVSGCFFFFTIFFLLQRKIHACPLCLRVFHFSLFSFDFFYKSFSFFRILPFNWNWSYILFFILALIRLIFCLFFVPLNFLVCKF